MQNLAKCPTWPALLDSAAAALYLGGKPSRLHALIALGWLEPFSQGHRNTVFRREDIDTALAIAAANGESANLVAPTGVKSVAQAVERRRAEQKKMNH